MTSKEKVTAEREDLAGKIKRLKKFIACIGSSTK